MEVMTEQTFQQQNADQNIQPQLQIQPKTVQMLCPLCGISFNPGITKTNICVKCLSSQTNIKEGITQEGVINFCRQCKRYQRPPWIYCERESREMLSLCLKKIKGLNKVKLIDACFVWTEEHSKRIKVKLTIQKEILNNINIQETFVVEFIEHYTQCDDCKKEYTPHTWGALVQVRQRVEHKKTFFYLEQLILKHNVHEKCLRIKEEPEGLDFYYKNKTQAQRLIDFLQSMFPTKVKTSKQLISTDIHSNLYNYKFTFYIELPRICRDDLVIIPNKLKSQLGGCNQILICSKVSSSIHFIDAISYRVVEMNSLQYYQFENDMVFIPLKGNETEFMINNVEHDFSQKKQLNLSIVSNATSLLSRVVDVEVSRMSDWQTFSVKSHLGDILKCGTSVIGYDLTTLNLSNEDINIQNLADIILIKKVPQTKSEKKRIWKLKRMNIEEIDEGQKKKKADKKKNNDEEKRDQEFEEFLEDVETHPDMRQNMNLFRDEKNIKEVKEQKKQKHEKRDQKNAQKRKVKVKLSPEAQHSQLEEEKMTDQNKNKNQQQQKQNNKADHHSDSDWEDVSDDDNVKLAELLKDLNLNEKEEPQVENEEFFNDFVQKMDNIKIENKPSNSGQNEEKK